MIPSFLLPTIRVSSSSSSLLMMTKMMLTTILILSTTQNNLVVAAQQQDDSSFSSTGESVSPRPSFSPTVSSKPSEFPSVFSTSPTPGPTAYVPTLSMSPSETPSGAPSGGASSSPTFEPTEQPEPVCENSRGWAAPATFMVNGEWIQGIFSCDHPSISCQRTARLGPATEHCCKCRPECCGQCNVQIGSFWADPCSPGSPGDYGHDNPNTGPYYTGGESSEEDQQDFEESGPMEGIDILRFIFSAMGVTFCVIVGLLAIRNQQSRELRDARRIMAERRRMQREREREEGREPAEHEVYARYEQIVTAFLFHNVNADKTNISAESIRGEKAAAGDGGDGEAVSEGDTSSSVSENPSNGNENSLTDRLSSWTKPSPKDECCICLESYSPGETICVPVSKECDHVFHEECIVEWLKKHTDCPLCRVQVIRD